MDTMLKKSMIIIDHAIWNKFKNFEIDFSDQKFYNLID